jgi:hypothetical protein
MRHAWPMEVTPHLVQGRGARLSTSCLGLRQEPGIHQGGDSPRSAGTQVPPRLCSLFFPLRVRLETMSQGRIVLLQCFEEMLVMLLIICAPTLHDMGDDVTCLNIELKLILGRLLIFIMIFNDIYFKD